MLICDDPYFVYMAPKKTGSTTVRTALAETYNARIYRDYPDARSLADGSVSPDWRSQGPDWKHVCHLPERFAGVYTFATVRSPYELEISRYLHDTRHEYINCDFGTFVRRLVGLTHPPTLFRKLHQNPDYTPPPGCVRFALDAVVRVEHLESDLRALPFYRGDLRVGHLHKSYAPRPAYSTDLAKVVQQAYAEDFAAFGYDPGNYPKTSYVKLL